MRPKFGLWLVLGAVIGVVACAAAPELPPVPRYTPAQLASVHWRAVLVAGDGRLRVFDDAVASMADWLHQRGVGPDEIARLSATPATIAGHGADSASWGHILHAIRDMKAGPGEACLVYVTSHGIRGEGVELSFDGAVLLPGELDRALAIGCGNAPTVAIVSACFSGSFAAPPMERANRIVITAARADRTSFGCSADQTYTYFDRCLLANLDRAPTWQALFDAARACVEQRERRSRFVSSQPQGWFGQAVAEMPLPGSAP
jgi:Peptidase C13 family